VISNEGGTGAAARALDHLAKAKLHGSLRDGCIAVLGGAFIGASSKFVPPQEWVLFGVGCFMAIAGAALLVARGARSVWQGVEG
jgi:hypothetical protein